LRRAGLAKGTGDRGGAKKGNAKKDGRQYCHDQHGRGVGVRPKAERKRQGEESEADTLPAGHRCCGGYAGLGVAQDIGPTGCGWRTQRYGQRPQGKLLLAKSRI
jgi:hypothetical protein